MQLGFAILLPDDVHNAIRRVQLAIAQACGSNPALKQYPHVTLKQPFHAKSLRSVEEYFDAVVSSAPSLRLEIPGVDRFEADGVVFAPAEGPPELEHLRRDVLRELGDRFRVKPRDIEGDGYRFHATLAYNLPDGMFDRAWEIAQSEPVDLGLDVETLGLFYYTGDEWILYKRAALGHR